MSRMDLKSTQKSMAASKERTNMTGLNSKHAFVPLISYTLYNSYVTS